MEHVAAWFQTLGINITNLFFFTIANADIYLVGVRNTLILAFFAVFFGAIFGTFIALMKLSKWKILRVFANLYIEVLRGTPLILQIFIWKYAVRVPKIAFLGVESDIYIAGILALFTNSAAYVAEIVRAGIQAVDSGQMEAARSLGMSSRLAMSLIVLPQAFRNILPALGNEFVVVIKESSLVSVIGLHELMFNSQTIIAMTYKVWYAYIACAFFYLFMTITTSRLVGLLERRLKAGAGS